MSDDNKYVAWCGRCLELEARVKELEKQLEEAYRDMAEAAAILRGEEK